MSTKFLFLLLGLLLAVNTADVSANAPAFARSVTVWNKTGVTITLCLKNKQNCYEGHPCCNWQAYKWVGVDKGIVVVLSDGEVLNFRYNKADGNICAAGTVEFVLADNPGQKTDVYLR